MILSQIGILSKADWEGKDFAKPSLKPMLGSGPYKIKNFQPGKFVVLERVKDYWAENLPTRKGFFNFDEVRFDFYQDTTVTLQALFSGNIDVREEYIAKIWVTGYNNDKVKNGQVVKEAIEHNNPAILQSFAFNIRRPKFADRRVREAIGLAFNFDWANDRLFTISTGGCTAILPTPAWKRRDCRRDGKKSFCCLTRSSCRHRYSTKNSPIRGIPTLRRRAKTCAGRSGC